MKKIVFVCLLLAVGFCGTAQTKIAKETQEERETRLKWWNDATFGLFIHWGAYAVPAGEYKGVPLKKGEVGEWIMHQANVPTNEYEAWVKQFNPVKFDAKEWVRVAKDAGVKYIVITSKHHDGFCLWNSKVTNYDIMDFAPFKRDILRELTNECKAQGIRICFYYSIMDWHQPDAESKKEYPHQNTPSPQWSNYRENYLKPQLAELVKNYDPGVLWFDGEWIPEWTEPQGKNLYYYLRGLKPNLIINNRVGKGRKGMSGMNAYQDAAGDFGTPEQEILEGTANYAWESCMTMNDTWGFRKDDQNWKSAATLVHNLVDIAAKGGNYLLNIGPTAQGLIPPPSVERLAEMGKWLRINGEAIYATNSIKTYKEGENIKFTESKNSQFVYAIATKLEGKTLTINSIKSKPNAKVFMLGVKQPLKAVINPDGSTTVTLPAQLPCEYAWTVRLEVEKGF